MVARDYQESHADIVGLVTREVHTWKYEEKGRRSAWMGRSDTLDVSRAGAEH